VGVIVFSELDTKIVVHNFVLSCRAFSRGIEFEMINVVRKYAKEKTICFEYKKTDRNNVLGDLINILTNHAESEFMLIDKLFEKKLNEYNGVLNVS
jgi:predicted enzyme involved in methoxymalonyl-ACP biosynthesis